MRFQSFPSNQSRSSARQCNPTAGDQDPSTDGHTRRREIHVTTKQKTIIVTGASQGIGAAVANLFLDRGYNVVGNSRKISHKNELRPSDKLALVEAASV